MTTAQGYASLRINKPGVTALTITTRTGLEPTYTHEAGDERPGVGTRFREAMWSLSTKDRGEGPLPDHLSVLLDSVEPKRAVLEQLESERFRMDWFCYVRVPGNGGLELTPALLRRLGALPVTLDLDIYG